MMEALFEVTTQSRSRSIYLKKKTAFVTAAHTEGSGASILQIQSFKYNKIYTENLQIQVISSSSRTFTKYTANKTACQCGDESLRALFKRLLTRTIQEQMSNVNLVIRESGSFDPSESRK